MRKATIHLTERTLMCLIGGQLFNQAPNRQPRKAEIIMTKFRDSFREKAHNDNEYYSIAIEEKESQKFIKDLLFNIPEFKELNLSQVEFDNGISVDDESRAKFKFSSAYDKYTTESWKTDFIDLDAFIQNIMYAIGIANKNENDCFCCIHEDTISCNDCCINPKFKMNYECSRNPKGKYTISCKYNCYRSRQICCDECSDKESCDEKCGSSSKDCGLTINKVIKEEKLNGNL